MQVETYEVLSIDVDANGNVINETVSEEALALIETLGLEGQQELVARQPVGYGHEEVERRIPYRQTTAEEKAIFATLFPVKTSLHRYKGDAIPLRVLQVAAHAKELEFELYVLHPATNVRVNDPVLVGERSVKSSAENGFTGKEQYLLARWGDALESLDELRKKALPIAIEKLRMEASLAKKKFERVYDDAEELATMFLRGLPMSRDTLPQFVSISFPEHTRGN